MLVERKPVRTNAVNAMMVIDTIIVFTRLLRLIPVIAMAVNVVIAAIAIGMRYVKSEFQW